MTPAKTIPVTPDSEDEIQRLVGALGDATRRKCFFHVRQADSAQSKDQVATALGIERRLAGFHLDKLVEQGFLVADYQRRNGRTGPGAGRPAKLYSLAEAEVVVSLPERHYDLLASLLLKAMQDRSGDPADSVLQRVGREFGQRLGEAELTAGRGPATATDAVHEVVRLLTRYGFAAHAEGESGIKACACPFEEMAFDDPVRVCSLDRAIWQGVLSAFAPAATLGEATARARGDEACVVEIVAP